MEQFGDFLKFSLVVVLLLALGLLAVVTLVLVSWPLLAFLGARLA